MPLENQHRSQSHCINATPANINAHTLGLLQHLIPPRAIPSNEGALTLTPQVRNFVWISIPQAPQLGVQILAHAGRVFDQIQPLNLLDDGAEQDDAGGIAHPSVELAVGMVGPQV